MSEAFNYEQVLFGTRWSLQQGGRNLGGLRLDRALRTLVSRADLRCGRILEVGCGVGRFTSQLSAQLPDYRVMACDLSQAAVVEAARRGGHVDYVVADALFLPYADGQFDAVVFFDLLEHLERPGVALAEFARVTREDGLLHGYVPCEGQPPTLHWLLGHWTHAVTRRHAGHIRHFRHLEIVGQVQQAGFAMLDLSYSVHLVGQVLDLMVFAAREVVFRRRDSQSARPEAFYDRSVLGNGWLNRTYGAARRVADAVAYTESRLLSWCPGALGLHLTACRMSDREIAQHRLESGGHR